VTWLTWRIERSALLSAAALAVVFALAALMFNAHDSSDMGTARTLLELGPPAFATMVAVFWGAPTIAREYEQRTYKLVWSRERPATRWLALRVGHLLAPLAVLTVGVNLIANLLQVNLLPSVRLIDTGTLPPGSMTAGVGYLDQAGHELPVQDVQSNCLSASTQYKECMARGIAHGYLDIHPADQVPQLRLVELGIYVALAVVTFAAAWLVLRRRTVS
jgi:hypothetical protein